MEVLRLRWSSRSSKPAVVLNGRRCVRLTRASARYMRTGDP